MNHLLKTFRSVSTTALALGLASTALSPGWAQSTRQPQEAPASQSARSAAWGIVGQEIEADASIRFGVLANGMRYALTRNANPSGEAAIRFTVNVGNRDETDAENGAAHFIEHMAFNGTTNIPEGKLLPMLERLGLAFGADTNAETSLDYTTYKLALPNTNGATVDTGLMVIREMAGEMTIAPEAVERERGILLSEAQVRNNPQRRRSASYFEAALPGSRIGERISADVERIRAISAQELRAFYEGYYRPERSTLAVVGDFDVEAMEKKIRALFGDWKGKGQARETYTGPVPDDTQPTIANFVDPAIPEVIELKRLSAWAVSYTLHRLRSPIGSAPYPGRQMRQPSAGRQRSNPCSAPPGLSASRSSPRMANGAIRLRWQSRNCVGPIDMVSPQAKSPRPNRISKPLWPMLRRRLPAAQMPRSRNHSSGTAWPTAFRRRLRRTLRSTTRSRRP